MFSDAGSEPVVTRMLTNDRGVAYPEDFARSWRADRVHANNKAGLEVAYQAWQKDQVGQKVQTKKGELDLAA